MDEGRGVGVGVMEGVGRRGQVLALLFNGTDKGLYY